MRLRELLKHSVKGRKNRKKSVNHRSAKFLVNIDFQVLAVNCIFIFIAVR